MMNNKFGKISSISFILMLIISTFAFAYIIGSETKMVSGVATTITLADGKILVYDLSDLDAGYSIREDLITPEYETQFFKDTKNPSQIKDTYNQQVIDGVYKAQIAPTQKSPEVDADAPDTQKVASTAIGTTLLIGGKQAASSIPDLKYAGITPLGITSKNTDGITTTLDTINTGDKFVLSQSTGQGDVTRTVSVNGRTPVNIDQNIYNSLQTAKGVEYSAISNSGKTLPAGSTPISNGKWLAPSGGIYSIGRDNKAVYEGRGDVANPFGESFGPTGWGAAQLLNGLKWAGIAAGLTLTIGSLFIKDQATLMAATAGISGGIMIGYASYALIGEGGMGFTKGWLTTSESGNLNMFGRNAGLISGVIGAASAWLIYNAMWSKTKTSTETVTFNCLPWEAPNGGKDCELCNDATLPCSEYRCKSLGQSCAIVNKGTKEERCVNVNPRDSSPPVITPNNADLSEGFTYFDVVQMPPGAGFKVKSKNTTTGCIPAYTPVKFGIITNEPSQCKIDIEPKGNYSKMATYMNGDNLYAYNHSELLNLPSSADIKNSSLTLKNGKELIFYIRCKDAAGNSNEADYALTLCVDPSPDTTAPVLQGSSIQNKGCVPAEVQNATVDFYINEPSECRWNYVDTSYDQMKNNMACSTNAIEINAIQSYTCTTKLNGIARDGTNFYVRCKDQPQGLVNESKRNSMQESYMFTLRGSNQLKLKVLQPNETIYGAIRPTPVELYAETLFGCDENMAVCYYSTTNATNSFVQFFDTNKQDGVHTQRLDLTEGTYTYFVRCVDAGGNVVSSSTTFKVSIDTNAPVIARAYEEDGYLKLVTPLNSECVYNSNSCDYLFSEGTSMPYANSTTHVTEWVADKKYFIKCRDQYRSEPVDCSLIVRPTENFLSV